MRKALHKLIVWFCAPVLNSRRDSLSLGRLLLFVYTLALIDMLVVDLPRLVVAQANPGTVFAIVFLLVVIFLVLAVYCFGDKPWVRETVLLLANRASLNTPGDFSQVTRFTQRTETGPQSSPEQTEMGESEPGI